MGEKAASYERAGGGGGAVNFGDGGLGGMNNRNVMSYLWDNLLFKFRNVDFEDEVDVLKEKTVEEMFGMDKESSKKMLKKKVVWVKEVGVLYVVVVSGDVVDVCEFFEFGVNVNELKLEEDLMTSLFVVVVKGNVEMVKFLIKSGVNLDV